MMRKIQTQGIINELENTDGLNTVQVITDSSNKNAAIYFGDKFFTIGYEITDYNKNTLETIKEHLPEEVLLFSFSDNDLTEAWKTSYIYGGIPEDRWDRRTVFHQYNEHNEMFCIDRELLDDITGKWIGTPWEGVPEWKEYAVKWYKNHLI